MGGILATIIITVMVISMAEMLLPKGNIEKIAVSVMGIIVVAIIIAPVVEFIGTIDRGYEPEYNFYQGGQ